MNGRDRVRLITDTHATWRGSFYRFCDESHFTGGINEALR